MKNRIPRVNELLKEEIGNILLREVVFEGALITITRVDASSDLRTVNIFISVLPEKEFEKVFKFLNGQIYDIQQLLNKKLRMRPIPRIRFVREKLTSEAGKIEEILAKIGKEKD